MELIDREKLKTTIRNMVELPNEVRVKVLGAISRAKAVDAVEVVRCKDCIHATKWRRHGDNTVYQSCKFWHGNPGVGADSFCSYGERRTDNA